MCVNKLNIPKKLFTLIISPRPRPRLRLREGVIKLYFLGGKFPIRSGGGRTPLPLPTFFRHIVKIIQQSFILFFFLSLSEHRRGGVRAYGICLLKSVFFLLPPSRNVTSRNCWHRAVCGPTGQPQNGAHVVPANVVPALTQQPCSLTPQTSSFEPQVSRSRWFKFLLCLKNIFLGKFWT